MTIASPNAPVSFPSPVSSSSSPSTPASGPKLRGFAALKARGELWRVRQIAQHGGERSVALKRNHRWTSAEASVAGKAGAAKRTENLRARRQSLSASRVAVA